MNSYREEGESGSRAQRLTIEFAGDTPIYPSENGGWVRWKEHAAEVAAIRKEVLAEVREALNRAMYINEGDDPAILDAALRSVRWHTLGPNGEPHAAELQHAIGTFIDKALATLTDDTEPQEASPSEDTTEGPETHPEGTIRFVHPVSPRGSAATVGVDLLTALDMARNGGDIEVWRAEYRKWFMLVPGGTDWRVDLLLRVAQPSEGSGAPLPEPDEGPVCSCGHTIAEHADGPIYPCGASGCDCREFDYEPSPPPRCGGTGVTWQPAARFDPQGFGLSGDGSIGSTCPGCEDCQPLPEGEECVGCGGPKPPEHPQFCADCGANYDSTDGD